MEHLLLDLEQSGLGTAMRTWRWLYPIVNTVHIAGIALLFGSVVSLDLRYLGLWKSVELTGLVRVLVPMALVGFGLACTAGGLLFIDRCPQICSLAVVPDQDAADRPRRRERTVCRTKKGDRAGRPYLTCHVDRRAHLRAVHPAICNVRPSDDQPGSGGSLTKCQSNFTGSIEPILL